MIAVGLAAVAGYGAYQMYKKANEAVGPLEWRQYQDSCEGCLMDFNVLLEQVAQKGLSQQQRQEGWPFLLQVYPASSTLQDRKQIYQKMTEYYIQKIFKKCQILDKEVRDNLPEHNNKQEGQTMQELLRQNDKVQSEPANLQIISDDAKKVIEYQRIIVWDAIRIGGWDKIDDFQNPQDDELLRLFNKAGKILNGLQDKFQNIQSNKKSFDGQSETFKQQRFDMKDDYYNEYAFEALSNQTHMSSEAKVYALRLVKMLLAYSIYDYEIGYCQGMCDLAQPFVLMFEDDVLAFWCFERAMQTFRQNFRQDEEGIQNQLFAVEKIIEVTDLALAEHIRQIGGQGYIFAYKMILAMLRRECQILDVMRLWEQVWSIDTLKRIEDGIPLQPLFQKRDQQSANTSSNSGQAGLHIEQDHFYELNRPSFHQMQNFDSNFTNHNQDSSLVIQQQQQYQQQQQRLQLQQSQMGELSQALLDTSNNGQENIKEQSLDPLYHSFFIFVVAATIKNQRRQILDESQGLDNLITIFNSLSNMDVPKLVQQAQWMRFQYCTKVKK